MKTISQIVAGGGWRGTRRKQIKVKAGIALIFGMAFGGVSVFSIGSIFVYACIPAVVILTVSVVLFVREKPVEIESPSGRVGADPRKLYGGSGGGDVARIKRNPEEYGMSNGEKPPN